MEGLQVEQFFFHNGNANTGKLCIHSVDERNTEIPHGSSVYKCRRITFHNIGTRNTLEMQQKDLKTIIFGEEISQPDKEIINSKAIGG